VKSIRKLALKSKQTIKTNFVLQWLNIGIAAIDPTFKWLDIKVLFVMLEITKN